MNDQTRPVPTEPIAPTDAALGVPFSGPGAAGQAPGSGTPGPAVAFSGRTPRRTEAVRAGVILGTGLVVAVGAAVALGASPSPAPSASGQPGSVPGYGSGGGPGRGPGFGAGLGPGIGGFGLGMPFGNGGIGRMEGRGFGGVSVTAISGSSLSLATDDGWTRTITVASTTTITKGGASAKLSDIAIGDTIRFSESRNADGSFTITAIEVVVPHVAGTVSAIGADTFTITLRDGTTRLIRTTSSTAYHLDQAAGKRSDVTVGSTIVASGDKAADGSLTADSVWVELPRVVGNVTAATSSTITLKRLDGTTVTIHVGSGTTIRVNGAASGGLSDIKAGMTVVVEGTQRSDGSIDATEIDAGARGMPGFGMGRDHGFGPGGPASSPSPSAASGSVG